MANLNKVMLIGRLTRDPEIRTFSNGGKVAKIGFAVNNRKKNQQTGAWEDEPVFLDIDAFNRETGRKLADLVEQYLKKGNQVYIEGNLVLDQWTDKDGQKRNKLKIVMQDMQFLESKQDGLSTGDEGGGGLARAPRPAAAAAPQRRPAPSYGATNGGGRGGYDDESEAEMPPRGGAGNEEDIPF
jgi:single-strand DNA-binding protein